MNPTDIGNIHEKAEKGQQTLFKKSMLLDSRWRCNPSLLTNFSFKNNLRYPVNLPIFSYWNFPLSF
jgi:hypothetical protein